MHRTLAVCVGIVGLILAGEGFVRPTAAQPGENFHYGDLSADTGLVNNYTGVPTDAATFDYNHDGTKDLLLMTTEVVWAQTMSLDGVPQFEYQQQAFPCLLSDHHQGIVIADYNNDSWIDFYVPSYSTLGTVKGHKLYRNNAGTFADVTASVGAEFSASNHKYTTGGAWGDYDGDGKLDLLLLAVNPQPGNDDVGSTYQYLMHNETVAGVTTFTDENGWSFVQKTRIRQAFWADLNKDHDLDLVLMQGCNDLDMCPDNNSTYYMNVDLGGAHNSFRNAGNYGAFPGGSLLKGDYSMGTVADVNNDGNVELVYMGNGRMGYLKTEPWTSGVPTWGQGEVKLVSEWEQPYGASGLLDIVNLDFNLDGRRDFLGSSGNKPALFKNYDNGPQDYAFPTPDAAIKTFGGPGTGGDNDGVLAANFANDGFTDLYFARSSVIQSSFAGFFYKTIDPNPDTHPTWVGIRLQASMGSNNYCGIGATVTVTAGSWVQSQIVDGGSSMGTQNDLDLIFGLGDYSGSTINVQILWPAGQTNCYAGLAVDQLHTLGDLPNVVDASVSSGLIYHAATGVTDWVFTWTTGPNSDVAMDKVTFNTNRLPANCIPAYSVLTQSVPNVTVDVAQDAQGTYQHTLTWLDAGCSAVCNIPFTVESGGGTYSSASSRKFFKVEACLSGGN